MKLFVEHPVSIRVFDVFLCVDAVRNSACDVAGSIVHVALVVEVIGVHPNNQYSHACDITALFGDFLETIIKISCNAPFTILTPRAHFKIEIMKGLTYFRRMISRNRQF